MRTGRPRWLGRHGGRVRKLEIGFVVLFAVFLVAMLMVFAHSADRSFLVEARTFGAEIVADGASRGIWNLAEGVLVCRFQQATRPPASTSSELQAGEERADADPPPEAGSSSHEACHPDVYEVSRISGNLEFLWPAKTEIFLLAGQSGELIVEILATLDDKGVEIARNLPTLPAGSLLVVPQDVLTRSGTLPFSGGIEIGAEGGAGIRGVLHSGRYSIHETLLFRSNPIPIVTGEINLGDQVSFRMESEEDVAFGIVVAGVQEEPGVAYRPFRLVAYTEPSDSEMVIRRFSGVPRTVSSNWSDRALHDPLLLAATVILTVATLILSIAADVYSFLRGDDKAHGRTYD